MVPDVAAACRALGGVARSHELSAAGVSKRHLRQAVDEQVIVRIRGGLHALPETDGRVLAAARHGGAPACTTAAAAHGLWTPHDERLHVWMGRAGNRRPHPGCRCRQHWDEGPPLRPGELPSIPRVLSQIAGCLGDEAFFACVESALHLRAIDAAGIDWLRRHVPQRFQELIDFARSDAGSGLESIVRLRLHRAGVAVRCQVRIFGVGDVDFLIGDRLITEVDGKPHHDGAGPRHRDYVRDANGAIWGYETLRFDYPLVMHEWDLVEAAILAKVDAGAHLWPRR